MSDFLRNYIDIILGAILACLDQIISYICPPEIQGGFFLCFVLCFIAGVAQWPEQLICNQLAGGSNPSTGSPKNILYILHVTECFGGTPELESRGRL